MPDDVTLLNLMAQWAPDAKLRHRILVENPERFYGFDPEQADPKPVSRVRANPPFSSLA